MNLSYFNLIQAYNRKVIDEFFVVRTLHFHTSHSFINQQNVPITLE
jgi:hypothetical protein